MSAHEGFEPEFREAMLMDSATIPSRSRRAIDREDEAPRPERKGRREEPNPELQPADLDTAVEQAQRAGVSVSEYLNTMITSRRKNGTNTQ